MSPSPEEHENRTKASGTKASGTKASGTKASGTKHQARKAQKGTSIMAHFRVTENHLLALEPLERLDPLRHATAIALLVGLGMFAAKRETDGSVDAAALKRQIALWKPMVGARALADLVGAGLVNEAKDGALAIAWDGQPAAKQLRRERAAGAARKRRQRAQLNEAVRSAAHRVHPLDSHRDSYRESYQESRPGHLSQVPETFHTTFSDETYAKPTSETGLDFAQFSTALTPRISDPRPPCGGGSDADRDPEGCDGLITLDPRTSRAAHAPVGARAQNEENNEAATRGESENGESNAVEPDWMAALIQKQEQRRQMRKERAERARNGTRTEADMRSYEEDTRVYERWAEEAAQKAGTP